MPVQLKGTLIALLMLFTAFTKASADNLSYIYIQGDKETPFYVKLEGEMQPRYGKNYCIIPKLAAGEVNIEVLFQQNLHPAQKFTIRVPANGYRGFRLTLKDGVYALYDLQQSFYLSPGNTADDDVEPKVKEPIPVPPSATASTLATTNNNTSKPKTNTATKPKTKPVVKEPKVAEPVDDGNPKFIDNIELNNERTFGDNTTDTPPEETTTTAIINSDCPSPINRGEYEDVLKKARSKGDGNRLKYLLDQTDKCYTTMQVRALTRSLTKDPERYAFLKQVYPHVTDQANFPTLEATLTSKEWKQYFQLILP